MHFGCVGIVRSGILVNVDCVEVEVVQDHGGWLRGDLRADCSRVHALVYAQHLFKPVNCFLELYVFVDQRGYYLFLGGLHVKLLK